MTDIAQQSLHFELSNICTRDCFKNAVTQGFAPYTNHLNLLKNEFEEEVDKNLKEIDDYPLAYKYVMETLYEFQILNKYHYSLNSTNSFLDKCCSKALGIIDETTKEIVGFLGKICSMTCDFLVLKSDLLKQLKSEYFGTPTVNSSNLKWSKNVIDLIELAKLMKETKMVESVKGKLTLKDLVNDLSTVFGVEIKGLYSKVSKAKSRKVLTKPIIYQVMEEYIHDY